MSSTELQEFHENFDSIKKIYEECLQQLTEGVEKETMDEEEVSSTSVNSFTWQ